jgi:hypothetical protein
VLVGQDQPDGVPVPLQGLIDAAHARLEFLARRHVLAVDGWRLFENTGHAIEIASMARIDGVAGDDIVCFVITATAKTSSSF